MHLPPLFRAVALSRRGRRSAPAVTETLVAPAPRRHPAMAGLDVSPVHGRHCICERCQRTMGPAV